MKRMAISFFVAVCLGLSAFEIPSHAVEVRLETEIMDSKKTETITFSVSMKCEKCVDKIKENISFEKGVKSLEISLEDKKVTIEFDSSKTSGEKLAAAIRKLGFKVDGK